ncbi:MAG: transposase [Pseudonocardia sp.]|uniref:hypothetical protein n=1 Tax=Pseudonocardia sp. TaxID=60912 RepID=UPI002601FDCE|nr:hypothetical protein [Pseudonocardia sp.]MCU1627373.1 transposase [Pseudonocardia sp.]
MDWSWSEHAVCAIDETGAAIEQFTVKHSAAGLGKLVTLLHLLDARLTVFVIASWQVTALRSRYGTAASKDDRFDAYLLADVLRHRPPPPHPTHRRFPGHPRPADASHLQTRSSRRTCTGRSGQHGSSTDRCRM